MQDEAKTARTTEVSALVDIARPILARAVGDHVGQLAHVVIGLVTVLGELTNGGHRYGREGALFGRRPTATATALAGLAGPRGRARHVDKSSSYAQPRHQEDGHSDTCPTSRPAPAGAGRLISGHLAFSWATAFSSPSAPSRSRAIEGPHERGSTGALYQGRRARRTSAEDGGPAHAEDGGPARAGASRAGSGRRSGAVQR